MLSTYHLSSASSIGHSKESTNATGSALAIDALYFPDPRSFQYSEIWLTSTTPRISIKTFFEQANFRELLTLVSHLDPIIQSSFFKKAIGFFPEHIETVLSKFNAIQYPEVISILDAKHQHWGSNCTNHVIVHHHDER